MKASTEALENLVSQTQGFKKSIVELTKSAGLARKDGGTVENKVGKLSNEIDKVKNVSPNWNRKNETQLRHAKGR